MKEIKNEMNICHAELVSASSNRGVARELDPSPAFVTRFARTTASSPARGEDNLSDKNLALQRLSALAPLRKAAFTLAEVLITLGIIGVVAALTIPTLVANYQNKAWNTAATVFERELEEGLKIMNSQQVLAGYKTTEKFVEELQKHVKITKVCTNDKLSDCFEDKVYWATGEETPTEQEVTNLKYGYQMGQEGWQTNVIGLQLANGSAGIFAYNPNCKQDPYNNQANVKSCIAMVYDTSGFANPNTMNKDVRSINVTSFNAKRSFKAGNTWYGTPFMPDTITNEECLKYLSEETCSYGNGGRWGAAVAKCGGLDKIPDRTKLGELAGYFCDKPAYGKGNFSNCTLNMEKVQQAGLIARSDGITYQIFGANPIENGVDTLFLTSNGIVYNQSRYPMGYNTFQAICITD